MGCRVTVFANILRCLGLHLRTEQIPQNLKQHVMVDITDRTTYDELRTKLLQYERSNQTWSAGNILGSLSPRSNHKHKQQTLSRTNANRKEKVIKRAIVTIFIQRASVIGNSSHSSSSSSRSSSSSSSIFNTSMSIIVTTTATILLEVCQPPCFFLCSLYRTINKGGQEASHGPLGFL